jgi:hypothetical protein
MTRRRSLLTVALTAAVLAVCASAYALTVVQPSPAKDEAVAAGAALSATVGVGTNAAGLKVTRLVARDSQTRATRTVRVIRGAWALPRPVRGAALEGLSWDGSIAVLRSVARPSRFVIVSLASKTPPRIVDLAAKGTFEFDALSVTGNWLFLSEYADPTARVLDRIRLYDIVPGKLRQQPVLDKLEGGETMAGLPVARDRSTDGVTVYTLYEAERHPFVHVLLTDSAISLCIDLPARGNLAAPGAWSITLDEARGTLRAVSSRLGKAYVIRIRGSIGTIVRIETIPNAT